jgi:hypothetical protein
MMGELTTAEIDQVLHAEVLGRIGCISDGAMRLARIETSASARLVQQDDVYRREGFLRPVLLGIRVERWSGRFELL